MRDDPQPRDPLAQEAERYLKDRDDWVRCDSERIGGHTSSEKPPSYNQYSDRELIEKYLQQKESERNWADDRR